MSQLYHQAGNTVFVKIAFPSEPREKNCDAYLRSFDHNDPSLTKEFKCSIQYVTIAQASLYDQLLFRFEVYWHIESFKPDERSSNPGIKGWQVIESMIGSMYSNDGNCIGMVSVYRYFALVAKTIFNNNLTNLNNKLICTTGPTGLLNRLQSIHQSIK